MAAEANNPNWSETEGLLLLDLFVRLGGRGVSANTKEVRQLSDLLNLPQLRPPGASHTYRNPNGVALQYGCFTSLDGSGRAGTKPSELFVRLWKNYQGREEELSQKAAALRAETSGKPHALVSVLAGEEIDPLLGIRSTVSESPPGTSAEGSSNDAVRGALAKVIVSQYPAFGSCAEALALAAHPWLDRTLPRTVLEVIASEMSTSRTLPHHDPRELAQDRLLRIAEALDELLATSSNIRESCGDLPPMFWGVASKLDSDIQAFPLVGSKVEEDMRLVSSLVGNTTGLNSGSPTPGAGSTTRAVSSDTEAGPVIAGEEALDFASALVAAYVRTGHDDLSQILGGSETGSSVLRLIESFQLGPHLFPGHDEFLQTLTDRDLAILNQRFTFPGERPPATLEEIGEQVDLTRERVRQIKKKLLDRLSSLKRTNSGVFDQLAYQVHLTERLITAAKVLTAGSAQPELLAKLLLWFEADWANEGDRSIGDQAADQFASLKDRLVEHADENLLLTEEALAAVVGDLFTSESARDTLLTKYGLIQICGFWGLRDNQQVRLAAALWTIGRPATKAEIGELAGLTESQVSSKAGLTANVVRADKTRWAFEEWIEHVYDGIAAGIEQRLDENDGEVSFDSLVEDLKEFDVKESSIKTYVHADAFLFEDGMVRRNPTNYKPRPVDERHDVVWDGGMCGQRLELLDQNFKGFSLNVSFDIAHENGLRPFDSVLVPFEGVSGAEVSVIWRPTSANRSVDVGRVAEPLVEVGFSPGDRVVVFATPDSVRIVVDDNPGRGGKTTRSKKGDSLSDLPWWPKADE